MPWRATNLHGKNALDAKLGGVAPTDASVLFEEIKALRDQLREIEHHRSEMERHRWEMDHRINQLADHVGVAGRVDKTTPLGKDRLYASLGWNCEAAYQFKRIIGMDRSSFFNWTYCHYSSLVRIVTDDFQNLLQWKNLSPSGTMIFDGDYNIAFHGAVFRTTGNGQYVELAKLHLAALQSKTAHLIEKWHAITASDSFVTYFLKLPQSRDARGSACALRDLFARKYPRHRFQIVTLESLEHTEAMPDWGEPGICNRYLDRFATDQHPDAAHDPSWDRIFAEFPLEG